MNYIGTIENDDGLTERQQIFIYGAGNVGRHTLKVLCEKGMRGKVAGFCDSNPDLCGKEIEGVPVLYVADACQKYPRGTYLVASMCVRQMVERLMRYGIEDIHIIRES